MSTILLPTAMVVVVREVVGAAQSREKLDALVERLTHVEVRSQRRQFNGSASTSRRTRRLDTLEARADARFHGAAHRQEFYNGKLKFDKLGERRRHWTRFVSIGNFAR